MIHITEKQTGKILDYIPLGDFWDDNHHKSLKDTLEYFEFRTFGDKRYSQHLEKMNRIIIPDEDGTFIEFVIFHAIKYRLQNAIVIDVYAPASYLLLKKAKVIKPQRVSEYTASQHLGFALNGTEWRPGIVESDKYRTLDIENHTNPYAYIKRIANEFELEPRFRVETDGNKVIGRYVDLLERVGEWQGREVEFGRDLLGIERKVDDSNVVTALIGLGPERDDGTRLEVFVEDEEALQRWGIPNPQTGELMHLIETYEPESTDQNMSIERLTELTQNELEKRINSVVEYTADVADLEKVPGMENKVIRFGDTIKIKDTGFNPPLYLEARVHTQDRSLSQPEKKKVTLGDFVEYTEEEVHAIWKQLQAEIAKKISMADVLEVTYTKEEIDEKDIPGKEAKAKIDRDVGEAIIETTDGSQDKADQAERNAKDHADSVANQARQEAITEAVSQAQHALNNAVNELETSIAEKADAEWVNGQLVLKENAITKSNTAPSNPTTGQLWLDTSVTPNVLKRWDGSVWVKATPTSAGEVGAYTKTEVDNALNSKVSITQYTTDMNGVITRLDSAESRITQTENKIATKVEKSEFDSVTNSLGNRISTIEQTADSISLEVSDIKANVYTKSEVDEAIDGIQIGGRNLLPTVFELYNLDGTYGYIKISDSQTIVKIYDRDVNVDISGIFFGMTGTGKDASGGYKWIVRDGTIDDNYYLGVSNNYPYFSFYPKTKETFDKIFRRFYIKIEKGNKATDWTPAPEDIDAQIADIEGTLESHSTKIEQNAQQIQLRATKTEVDTLTGRVSTVESTIQQHADMIESKIDAGDARSIFRQEASSFTFEASQINFKGHVFGEDATFVGELSTGIINTNEVYIGKKTLPFWEHFSSRIVMKNVIRITDDEFMDGEPFVIEVGNGDALISTPGSLELIANTVTIPGDIRLSDEGFVYTSAIDNHRAHASPHIYIRPRDANSEVRATVTGTITEYVKVRAREFVAGGINGDGIFSADNSIVVLRAGPDSYAFVQSDLEVRATKRFSGSSYVPVRASSFPSGSLEEFKTNIKKWEESALDIIRNADIYEYNLKNDLEVGKNKKRYGLVIGDGYRTPEEVIDGDGIEQYAMNSISWKAIQELDTEQQELKGRIAWLEAENKLLREKIKKLEGMIS